MLLSDPEWMRGGGRIVLLEPRRLAARAAATRMAAILNEPVGETVGYRVRFDSKVSRRTRIEVVTEGVLVQRLQRDPSLEGVAAVGSGEGGRGGGLPFMSTPLHAPQPRAKPPPSLVIHHSPLIMYDEKI